MFYRGLYIISKQLVYLTIILTAVLLLTAGALYLFSNKIEQQQDEIANLLSKQLGYPVTIGSANIQRLGLLPKLHLGQLEVYSQNHDKQLVSLDSLHLGLDVIASINQGEAVFNDISLSGVNIAVVKDTSGNIGLKDFHFKPDTSVNENAWFSWLNLLNSFHLTSIIVDYTDQSNPDLSGKYQLANAVVSHDESHWSTKGIVRLPSSLGKQLHFNLKIKLNEEQLTVSSWTGQFNTDNLSFSPFVQFPIEEGILIESGWANVSALVSGAGTQVKSVKTSVSVNQLVLKSLSLENIEPTVIDKLSGNFDWGSQKGGWQLEGSDVVLDVNESLWPEKVDFTVTREEKAWLVKSSYLRLSDLSSLALLTKFSPEIIRQQRPAGDIDDFNFHYSDNEGMTRLKFTLSEGGFLPWQDYPGVSNLTATIDWRPDLASVTMDSTELRIYTDKWLGDTLLFDSLTGSVNLQQNGEVWSMESEGIRFWNEDLDLKLDGKVKHDALGKTDSNLILKINRLAINQWQHYVPQKLLAESFRSWATPAFLNGSIIDGQINLVGDLAKFPFDKPDDKGHFKMALPVENVQLHYAPDWPDIIGVDGTVTGLGNELVIKSKKGTIAGFQFDDVTTTINRLMIDAPILRVDGLLKGTTEQALLFLRNSPLKQRFSQAIEGIVATGASNINLNLMVPLSDAYSTQVSGDVSFNNSELYYDAMPEVKLSNINGQLNFDGDQGVETTKNITATLLNDSVKVDVKPNGKETIISMEGVVSSQKVNAIYPQTVPSFINGETDYSLMLHVKEKQLGDFHADYELSSQLKGLEISLPAPFRKNEQQSIDINVTASTVDEVTRYSFSYGEVMDFEKYTPGEVWLAGNVLGTENGLSTINSGSITGHLAKLSIDEWSEWMRLNSNEHNLISAIDSVKVSVEELTGYKQKFTNIISTMNKDGQGWRVGLLSDQSNGTIYWPKNLQGPATLDIQLDKLKIQLTKETSIDERVKLKEMDLWPPMTVAIKEFGLGELYLGDVNFKASRSENQWLLNSGTIKSDAFEASLFGGSWDKTANGDSSRLKLKLSSNDLASTLNSLPNDYFDEFEDYLYKNTA